MTDQVAHANATDLRRKAFAEHVAGGKTGVDAARLAGYKGNARTLSASAARLLADDSVQALVAEVAAKASAGRILTAQRRREILAEIAEGETAQEIVTDGVMGRGTQTRRPTSAERVAAIKHLDELDGLLVQKHDVRTTPADLSQVPDDVLRARLDALKKTKGKT